jgi:hypothetical protein
MTGTESLRPHSDQLRVRSKKSGTLVVWVTGDEVGKAMLMRCHDIIATHQSQGAFGQGCKALEFHPALFWFVIKLLDIHQNTLPAQNFRLTRNSTMIDMIKALPANEVGVMILKRYVAEFNKADWI